MSVDLNLVKPDPCMMDDGLWTRDTFVLNSCCEPQLLSILVVSCVLTN